MVNVISRPVFPYIFQWCDRIYLPRVIREWIVTSLQFSHQLQKKDSIFYTVWNWNWLSISELSKISFTKRFALQRLWSRCHPWHRHSVFVPRVCGKAAYRASGKVLERPRRHAPCSSGFLAVSFRAADVRGSLFKTANKKKNSRRIYQLPSNLPLLTGQSDTYFPVLKTGTSVSIGIRSSMN